MKKPPLRTPGLVMAVLAAAQVSSNADLVARWNMNEMSGKIADTSGNNLIGTATGVAMSSNGLNYAQPSVTEGTYGAITVTAADAAKFGTSIRFNRAGSGMFQIGNPSVIGNLAGPGPTGSFTLMCWVNANVQVGENQRIFATGTPNGWGAGFSNFDRILFTTFGVADMRSGAVSANNVWQHMAYVWNAGTLEVFINGNSVYTVTSPGFNDETSTQYGIAGNAHGVDHFDGWMDDLKIFSTAMTQAEIVAAALPGAEITTAATNNFANDGAPEVFPVLFSNAGVSGDLVVSSVTLAGENAGLFTVDNFTNTLGPGENGAVELSFNPPGGSGEYTVNLQIASNDLQKPVRTVPVKVVVTDPVIDSEPRVDFGELAANPGPQTMSLTLSNYGGGTAIDVSAISFAGQGQNGFSVVSHSSSIQPGDIGTVVISFDPGSATGHFGDMLKIESNAANSPVLNVPVMASVALDAAPTPVAMVNGNFDAGAWESAIGTSPEGWTNSLADPPQAGFYGQAGYTPGLTTIAAHLQSTAGYYQQNLSSNNVGLTAGKVNSVTVAFDRFYRNDTYAVGHAMLRVSLWDVTNDVEIAGRNVVFENPGVMAGGNIFTATALDLAFDSSAYDAEEIAVRFARVEPFVVNANINRATLVIDNVQVSVDGDWEPGDGYGSWAVAMGLDGSPGKESGLADDPDGDGVSNFDEYAFGGAPLSGASGILSAASTVATTEGGLSELVFTIAVREDATFTGGISPVGMAVGVSYSVQGSRDLVDFDEPVEGPLENPVIPSTLPANPPAGYKFVSFRLVGSGGLTGSGFLRAVSTAN